MQHPPTNADGPADPGGAIKLRRETGPVRPIVGKSSKPSLDEPIPGLGVSINQLDILKSRFPEVYEQLMPLINLRVKSEDRLAMRALLTGTAVALSGFVTGAMLIAAKEYGWGSSIILATLLAVYGTTQPALVEFVTSLVRWVFGHGPRPKLGGGRDTEA